MPEKPVGQRSFEQFARRYASAEPTKPHNAYLNRPALFSLLPDVHGKRVLDAGCGPGLHAEEFLERGAHVVAVDVTPDFVSIARERLGERAVVIEADLNEPLTFLPGAQFDLVFSSLVLDYVADWSPLMSEFARVLRPGGTLLFSCGHPQGDFAYVTRHGLTRGNYFDRERFTATWTGFGEPYPEVTSYRRPLADILQPVIDAGFRLDRIVEPRPTAAFRAADPDGYEKLMRGPAFMWVRALK